MSDFLHLLLHHWLKHSAKAKVRDAVVQTARGELASPAACPLAQEPKSCNLGLVFAIAIESGCLEDLLQGAISIRGSGLVIREGGLRGRRVALILAGAGQENARRAADVLIDGHHPARVVSAGFAGGLCPKLKRNDILIADRLLNIDGGELPVELPPSLSAAVEAASRRFGPADGAARRDAAPTGGVHCGPLLTTDRVVRAPSARKALFDRTAALAVDMETFAVAEVCAARQVAFSSIRVINDTADEVLPRDVEHLLVQKTTAARVGAALGAVWRRPASAKEMYQLRENALVASSRLARFLAETLLLDDL
jgi:adenosylhomocysteine nucleosidase